MSVQLSASLTQRTYLWSDFKTTQTTKNLSVQYDSDGLVYIIWGEDGSEIHICNIYLGSVPPGIISATGYTQNQNDTDKTDFETNFKSDANGATFLNIQYQNKYKNIHGNSTTVVKSGGGILHSISINANYTGGTITVYDNTAGSGTKIMTLSAGSPSGGLLSTSGLPGPVQVGPCGAVFSTGLTVVTAGSSSNDITVYYQ